MLIGGYGAPSGDSKMRFLKRRFLRSGEQWDAALVRYQEHFRMIRDQLPEVAVALLKWKFHDEGVVSIQRVDKKSLVIELGSCRLEFLGVSHAVFPTTEQIGQGDVWLYDEIDLVVPGIFAMRALFDEYGFEVHATDVRIFNNYLKRYVLPPEAPKPGPTLFVDRVTRHSVGRKKKKKA